MTKGNLRWHGYEKKWLQITSTNLDHRHANAFHENEPVTPNQAHKPPNSTNGKDGSRDLK